MSHIAAHVARRNSWRGIELDRYGIANGVCAVPSLLTSTSAQFAPSIIARGVEVPGSEHATCRSGGEQTACETAINEGLDRALYALARGGTIRAATWRPPAPARRTKPSMRSNSSRRVSTVSLVL